MRKSFLIWIRAQVRKTKTDIKNLASREKKERSCAASINIWTESARGVGGRNMLLCSVGTLQRLQIQNVETFPLSRAFPPFESCSAFAAAREWARSRLSCKLKRNDLDRWQIFLLSLCLLFSFP